MIRFNKIQSYVYLLILTFIVVEPQILFAQDGESKQKTPQKLFFQARAFELKGKPQKAIDTYIKLVSNYSKPPELISKVKRKLIKILLSSESPNFDLIEKYLSELHLSEKSLDEELCNIRFSLFVKRIILSTESNRPEIWKDYIAQLKQSRFTANVNSMAHLRQLLIFLEEKENISFEEKINDLRSIPAGKSCKYLLDEKKRFFQMRSKFSKTKKVELKKNLPTQLRKLLFKGKTEELADKNDDAIKTYSIILQNYPDNRQIVLQTKRKLLNLLILKDSYDLSIAESYLNDLLLAQNDFDNELWNNYFRIILKKVANAPQNEQLAIWLQGLKKLKSYKAVLNKKSLKALEKKQDNSSSLSTEKIITDLLNISLDNKSKNLLRDKLKIQKIQSKFAGKSLLENSKDIPGKLKRLMLKATLLSKKGEVDKSLQIYGEIINEFSEFKSISHLAKRESISLLLESNTKEFNKIQNKLHELIYSDTEMDQELWNYKCRYQLRCIYNSTKEDRVKAWHEAVKSLNQENISINEDTIKELLGTIEVFEDDKELSSLKIVDDLLLLVPDFSSIQELNGIKTEWLARKQIWPEAIESAKMDILLGAGCEEGPSKAIRNCQKTMESAGLSPEENERFINGLFWDHQTDLEPKTKKTDYLSQAALLALKSINNTHSPRKIAFLNFYAANNKEAFRWAIENLKIKDNNSSAYLTAFTELQIIAAGQTGLRGILQNHGLVSYLPEFLSEKTSEARAIIEQRFNDWGLNAFSQGEINEAAGFFFQVIHCKQEPEEICKLIDTIVTNAKKISSENEIIELLNILNMHSSLQHVKGHLLTKIGIINYEAGNYERCLELLGEANKLFEKTQKDISLGFVKALSLIRLRRFEGAIEVLKQLGTFMGTEEQHARAEFLIGWILLQRNEKTKALLSFRRVIDDYGKTKFAKKARELVQRLEGV